MKIVLKIGSTYRPQIQLFNETFLWYNGNNDRSVPLCESGQK